MTEIKIDKGIPIPKTNYDRKNAIYPWHDLDLGDSFLLATKKQNTASGLVSGTNTRLKPKKFICRQTKEGWRVWRVK